MEPRKGEGDNQTNGKFGKLNQWKICISGFLSAERSPHINVLNVEMEPKMGDRFSFLNFPLVQFSLSPILGSISTFKTFMCGDLSALKKNRDANFPLVQFSELSIGSVIPLTHPRFRFNI